MDDDVSRVQMPDAGVSDEQEGNTQPVQAPATGTTTSELRDGISQEERQQARTHSDTESAAVNEGMLVDEDNGVYQTNNQYM